jgi:hypothetical protein
MNGIYKADESFDFSKLHMLTPTLLSGGNCFIKFRINDMPLYIKTPKCNVKQGILKSGKKYYTDLMFTNEHEGFIQWMEHLENHCHKVLFENKNKWFETELDEHDIENSFTSPLKLYKSGKFYLARVNIPSNLGVCTLSVYNENEELIPIEDVQEQQSIITVLEIQGIKFSVRSFHIEIEMKQMLVLNSENIFKQCILKKELAYAAGYSDRSQPETTSVTGESLPAKEIAQHEPIQDTTLLETSQDQQPAEYNEPLHIQPDLEKELSEEEKIESTPEIEEYHFELESVPATDTIQIKKRNDVYYEMYKEAKKKAKIARDLAMTAYLEAKYIKNSYLLNEGEDSDSDFDNEFFQQPDV